MLLHYSISINTPELKQCSFKSINNFQNFLCKNAPLEYQVSIHGIKSLQGIAFGMPACTPKEIYSLDTVKQVFFQIKVKEKGRMVIHLIIINEG